MDKTRILFSIPTQTHVGLATDELEGMQKAGYKCGTFAYAAKDGFNSKIARLWIILSNAFSLIKTAYRFKPDIIYFNSRVEVLAGYRDFITISVFKALYFKKVAFLLKSHGSDLEVFDDSSLLLRKIIIPFLRRNISGWLFLSSEERDLVVNSKYLESKNCFVVKNIVRSEQFAISEDFKRSLNIPSDHRVLLFVGRIIREKGIFEVIDAFDRIHEKYKISLVIVGDGIDFEDIKRTISSMGLSTKITLTGWLSEDSVVKYYSNSDILVFPTYFPEGFPMALFNSVGAGLSIVTTSTRAAIDYLSEPENCLWVKPKNSESVQRALEMLLNSGALTSQMRTNNKIKAKEFSREQVCREISSIVDKIVLRKNKQL